MPSKWVAIAEAAAQLLEALSKTRMRKEKAKLEKRLEKAMKKAFRAQGAAFVDKLTALKGRFPEPTSEARRFIEAIRDSDWYGFFDDAADETIELFTGPLDSATTSSILKGAKTVIADAGIELAFDLQNPRAIAYLASNPAAARVADINDTTRKRVKTLVDKAVKEGWGYEKLSQSLLDRFEEFAAGKPQEHVDSRAHLIAITEVGEAYSAGSEIAALDLEDAGVEMEKGWSTVGDDKVSDGCRANEDAGWIPISDPFPSGHQRTLRFPGCRCDTLYQAKED